VSCRRSLCFLLVAVTYSRFRGARGPGRERGKKGKEGIEEGREGKEQGLPSSGGLDLPMYIVQLLHWQLAGLCFIITYVC